MKIEIKRVTSWEDVVNAARFTWRKEPLGKEPSTEFKVKSILSEHSPLRELIYRIYLYDVPFFVVSHLVRHHEGINIFVATSRPDITKEPVSRHEQHKDDPTNVMFTMNAQAILNVSKLRLCNHAEDVTKSTWQQVINKLGEIDPILANMCQPSCVRLGHCPEPNCCGKVNFRVAHNSYWKGVEQCS